jgi:hypothetical protein
MSQKSPKMPLFDPKIPLKIAIFGKNTLKKQQDGIKKTIKNVF